MTSLHLLRISFATAAAAALVLSSSSSPPPCCHAFAPSTTRRSTGAHSPPSYEETLATATTRSSSSSACNAARRFRSTPPNRHGRKSIVLNASPPTTGGGGDNNNININKKKGKAKMHGGPLYLSAVSAETTADSFVDTDAVVAQGGDGTYSLEQLVAGQQQQQQHQESTQSASSGNPIESILSTYAGPRLILAAVACFYGTNFPLGAMMADAMPAASAVTSARMVLAALVLSPFLPQLKPHLRLPAILCGCFTSLGYVAQSLALVDTPPATVSFLGAATVLVCPMLEWALDGRPMGIKDAPQTWLSAGLCLAGVAALELMDPTAGGAGVGMGTGDALALLQAFGFGTGCYLSEKMMREDATEQAAEAKDEEGREENGMGQALPVTATLVATAAFVSMVWSFVDGWMFEPNGMDYILPNLFFEPSLTNVAGAVVWTGIASTSLNFFVEITALGRVPVAEASVILATEPLWAAMFGAGLLHETFGLNDYVGGFLVIMACLANTLKPEDIHGWFKKG